MKKIFNYFSLIFIFSLVTLITILSTVGLKTNKFNNLISSEIKRKTMIFFLNLNKLNLNLI